MRKFLPYFKRLKEVKWPFLGGLAAGVVYSVASGIGLPLVMKIVLPVLFGEEQEQSGWYYAWMRSWMEDFPRDTLLLLSCLWLPLVFLVRGFGAYFNAYLINYAGLKVLEGIRMDLFSKLMHLPYAFHQKHSSGDLIARLTGDTAMLRQVIVQSSSDLIKQPATLLSALGFLVWQAVVEDSVFIVLISLVAVPLCVFPIKIAGNQLAKRSRALQNNQGQITAALAESLQAPVEIRVFNMQREQEQKFQNQLRKLLRLSMKILKYRNSISPSIELVAVTGLSLALYVGVQQGVTLETFSAIGLALYMAFEPIKKLGTLHAHFRQGGAALLRIEEVMQARETLPESPHPKSLNHVKGDLRMDSVSLSYGDAPALRDISISIAAGECVALIGPSGAGKTSFVNLIPRLFDPVEGAVLLDGIDLRDLRKWDLRASVAFVPQTPILFSGTIRENILVGRPGATDEEIERAARRAYAHDFILAMPGGYEASVSEKGTSLSGGQRQRIALARAFLKDAPILILDEATSALDAESESRIQEALKDLTAGKTTLIIAHRLSTIRICHRILVFDQGRIVKELAPNRLEDPMERLPSLTGQLY